MWENQKYFKNFDTLNRLKPFKVLIHTAVYPVYQVQAIDYNVCSSDVMNCQISIFEIKMMVKIGVIIMLFSNPTCHFRDMS